MVWTVPDTSCRSGLRRTWWEPWRTNSCARFEAEERGLASELETFPAPSEALMDALAYADMTTGPTGLGVSVDDRLAEILERYGPDDPVHRPSAGRASTWCPRFGEPESVWPQGMPINRCRARTGVRASGRCAAHRWVDVEVVESFERDEPDFAGL